MTRHTETGAPVRSDSSSRSSNSSGETVAGFSSKTG